MPRIVYLSWPAGEIAGGIKLAFRHVEALREHGFEALVATPDGRPPGWFETTAPVVPLPDLSEAAAGSDVLVFPENHHGLLTRFADWPGRKIVFCQNPYMIVRGLGGLSEFGGRGEPGSHGSHGSHGGYADFGVREILCVGRHTVEFCRRRFPDQRLFEVPGHIDPALFQPGRTKRLQIAFMPRKRSLEAAVVRDLFRHAHPEYRQIPWIPVAGVPERRVAEVLRESAVFFALSRFEALSLATLEALASGCLSAGFTGFGAREYTTGRNGYWAAEDDCLEAADRLSQAVRLAEQGGPLRRDMIEAAVQTARGYSRGRFVARLLEFWKSPQPECPQPEYPHSRGETRG